MTRGNVRVGPPEDERLPRGDETQTQRQTSASETLTQIDELNRTEQSGVKLQKAVKTAFIFYVTYMVLGAALGGNND